MTPATQRRQIPNGHQGIGSTTCFHSLQSKFHFCAWISVRCLVFWSPPVGQARSMEERDNVQHIWCECTILQVLECSVNSLSLRVGPSKTKTISFSLSLFLLFSIASTNLICIWRKNPSFWISNYINVHIEGPANKQKSKHRPC